LTRVYEIGQSSTIDHDTSRVGRWLHARRFRIALWIAVVEAVIAWFAHDFSKWTIILLAAILVPVYLYWGRERKSDTLRQILWIAAASQALAIIAVIAAFIALGFVLVIAAIFAAVALVMIFADRR
jgi:H+/gluconate symporter-like permease